jgi:hypothetical protein
MPTLHGFMRQYPEIQLDMEFTDNLVDVTFRFISVFSVRRVSMFGARLQPALVEVG